MIGALHYELAAKREITTRLARAKGKVLTDGEIDKTSTLAAGLVDIGMPVADSFEAALNHKFVYKGGI